VFWIEGGLYNEAKKKRIAVLPGMIPVLLPERAGGESLQVFFDWEISR
jgi:hypothetical protein